MKYDDIDTDRLNFCAREIAGLGNEKGIALTRKSVFASLKGIIEGQNTVTASISEKESGATYSQSGDVVIAAIHSMLNGETERALRIFASIVAIDDAPQLAGALMENNEQAMLNEVNADTAFDEPGQLENDFGDHNDGEEDLDVIDNYTDDNTTMDDNAPLIDIGEEDDTYDSPEADEDMNASNTYNSPEYIGVGPGPSLDGDLTLSSDSENLDEIVASILEDGDSPDDVIEVGSANPIRDLEIQKRKEGYGDKKRVKLMKPHNRAKYLSGNELDQSGDADYPSDERDIDTDGELLAIMTCERMMSLEATTRTQIRAFANKISESGTKQDRYKALEFVKKAINVTSA